MEKVKLPDQGQRDQFSREVSVNCAMIAPAGVGKTYSIVERVLQIARHENAADWLPKLVVVTYTNAAALELQKRARTRITEIAAAEKGLSTIIPAFNQAFFGTIHSFCLDLLRRYGHFIGVPPKIDLLEDDDDDRLWTLFLQKRGALHSRLSEEKQKQLLRFVPIDNLLKLARNAKPGLVPNVPGDCPRVVPGAVMEFRHKREDWQKNVEISQRSLRNWIESEEQGAEFLPLPQPAAGGKVFTPLWNAALDPIRNWIEQATLVLVSEMARAYQEFRVERSFLSYDDQVALAAKLFEHLEVAKLIRSENYRIILDEAQDTDPNQFKVLIEASRDPSESSLSPRPGHLSMVGDSQQSIHGQRASLQVYRESHGRVIEPPAGTEATLTVTHRCSQKVVETVNDFFNNIFQPNEGQSPFVPLQARSDAPVGTVVRWPVENLPAVENRKYNVDDQSFHEAEQLARFIKEKKPSGLGADSWREVVILCARKQWFGPLAYELKKAGLAYEVQKHREIKGDHPAHAWFTALVWILAHPRDGYEIVGVLREAYGISDDELALYSNRNGDLFQILQPELNCSSRGNVGQVLHQLYLLRQQVLKLPVRAAAHEILKTTELRDRLAMLLDSADVDDALAEIITLAGHLELQGHTLVEWSYQLRRDFHKTHESPVTDRDAIQILTCHKAKGLEWQVVIVPFLFRKVDNRKEPYPRFVPMPGNLPPRIAFDKRTVGEDLSEMINLQERQELERLLYVACTRARNSLVLADDSALFNFKTGGKLPSFGELLLGREDVNRGAWNKLPPSMPALAPVTAKPVAKAVGDAVPPVKIDRKLSVATAASFPCRTTPHQLANYIEPGEPEVQRELPDDFFRSDIERGEVYGSWWHETMQHIPWSKPADWNPFFTQRLSASTSSVRSEHEWKLFIDSPLAQLLKQPGLAIRPEIPFLWNDKPGSVIEGIVDLACYDAVKKEWLIIDWKTNRLGEGGMSRLQEIYQPQVEAYVHAWKAIFGSTVRGGLYSTELGEWTEIEVDAR